MRLPFWQEIYFFFCVEPFDFEHVWGLNGVQPVLTPPFHHVLHPGLKGTDL
jgi:hypothetical protein